MSGIMSSVFGQRSTILAAVLGSRSYARLSIVNGKLELRSKTASKLLAIGQAEAAGFRLAARTAGHSLQTGCLFRTKGAI